MVDVELSRFPWTYSKVFHPETNSFIGFRVRIDFFLSTNPHDPFKFDIYHFTSDADRMDNASLAKDCGLEVTFGHTYILSTPRSFSHIYNQICEYENLCASIQSI